MALAVTRRAMVGLAAVSVLGVWVNAAPAPKPMRISTTYLTPPRAPGAPAPNVRFYRYQDPGYTGPLPPIPPINNCYSYVQIGVDGVRVDAWVRRQGGAWQYYGGQTSGRQGVRGVARFNPFYVPSGPAEVLFRANGYADNVMSIVIP
jgi:hypothetical protein